MLEVTLVLAAQQHMPHRVSWRQISSATLDV
jgi:hypothetical protein